MAQRKIKDPILADLARVLGVPPRVTSAGGTEPKAALLDVVRVLRLPIDPDATKEAMASSIARMAGLDWTRECDSSHSPSGGGGTITAVGLQRVLEATYLLSGEPATPQLRGVRGRPYEPSPPTPGSPPVVFERDPEACDRATRAHGAIQDAIAGALRARGVAPLSPQAEEGDPLFDLAWRHGGTLTVCEVKSATPLNLIHQARLGLGQLLDYGTRASLAGEVALRLVLATELPLPPLQARTCTRLGVGAIALPTLEFDVRGLLETR